MKTIEFRTPFAANRNNFFKAMAKTNFVVWNIHGRTVFRMSAEYSTEKEKEEILEISRICRLQTV